MKQPDSILDQLRKVKALADSGIDGERVAAQAMLEKLLGKYKLSMDDIAEPTRRLYFFTYKGKQEHDLLVQVICRVLRVSNFMSSNQGRTKLGIEVTPIQAAEIQELFDYYRKQWKDELHRFFIAFISKYQLVNPDRESTGESSWSPADLQALRQMMKSLNGKSSHELLSGNLRLPSGR